MVISFLNAKSTYNFTKDNVAEFNDMVDTLFSKLEMTGLSIIITKDGKLIYEYNKGYKTLPSERSPGQLLKTGDLFRIASISKSFVATVIMKLVEEEKLSLDDDAQKYLSFPLRNPNFPDIPITVDNLLTHTSSIIDKSRLIETINPRINSEYKNVYSERKPGFIYHYCNLNYNILGAIIEKVTNERFDKVVEEYILRPLSIKGGFNTENLDSTKFVTIYEYNIKKKEYTESLDAYKSYKEKMQNYILGESTSYLYPCAGMKISARDLAKYMNMHLNYGDLCNSRIILKETEEKLRQDYNNNGMKYGRAISTYDYILPNYKLYGATGGSYGLKSAMLFDPITKIGFIIISSGSKATDSNGMADIHIPIINNFFKLSDYIQF